MGWTKILRVQKLIPVILAPLAPRVSWILIIISSGQSLDQLGHPGDMKDNSADTPFQFFFLWEDINSSSGIGKNVHSLTNWVMVEIGGTIQQVSSSLFCRRPSTDFWHRQERPFFDRLGHGGNRRDDSAGHHQSLNREGHWSTTDDFTNQFSPFFPVLHCPLGLAEPQACPFLDVVFPPLPLSALSSSPFHCALQDGFGHSFLQEGHQEMFWHGQEHPLFDVVYCYIWRYTVYIWASHTQAWVQQDGELAVWPQATGHKAPPQSGAPSASIAFIKKTSCCPSDKEAPRRKQHWNVQLPFTSLKKNTPTNPNQNKQQQKTTTKGSLYAN